MIQYVIVSTDVAIITFYVMLMMIYQSILFSYVAEID